MDLVRGLRVSGMGICQQLVLDLQQDVAQHIGDTGRRGRRPGPNFKPSVGQHLQAVQHHKCADCDSRCDNSRKQNEILYFKNALLNHHHMRPPP